MDQKAPETPPPTGAEKAPVAGVDSSGAGPQSVGDSIGGVAEKLRELNEYVSFYVSARIDSLKQTFRRFGILAGIGVICLIAVVALVATAVVLICLGISEGISMLVRHRWLGDLITGVLILGAIFGALKVFISGMAKSSRLATMEKYESRRRDQKSRFGHDVGQKADEH